MSASLSSVLPLSLSHLSLFILLILLSSCFSLLPPSPFFSSPPAAGPTASSNAGAMNSLTSLGTLQGLAGATVGLNNINALAGSVNSEYSPCHQPLHLHLHFQPPIPTYLTAASLQQPVTRCRETKVLQLHIAAIIRIWLIWVFEGCFFYWNCQVLLLTANSSFLVYDKYKKFSLRLKPFI